MRGVRGSQGDREGIARVSRGGARLGLVGRESESGWLGGALWGRYMRGRGQREAEVVWGETCVGSCEKVSRPAVRRRRRTAWMLTMSRKTSRALALR